MKKVTIIITVMFMVFFLLTVGIGCKDIRVKSEHSYVEDEYSFPDNIQDILDVSMLDNGKLAVIGRAYLKNSTFSDNIDEPLRYYESSDNGESWREKKLRIPKKNDEKFIEYEEGKILGDGSFIFSIREYTKQELIKIDSIKTISEDEDKENRDNNPIRIVRGDSKGNLTEISSDKLPINEYKIEAVNNRYVYLRKDDSLEIIQFDIDNEEITNIISLDNKRQ